MPTRPTFHQSRKPINSTGNPRIYQRRGTGWVFIVDALGNFVTDEAGNRLIVEIVR